MFYIYEIEDYVRVAPSLFNLPTDEAVAKQLNEKYEHFVDKDIGSVITVLNILDVSEGIIIPGDGAAYYKSTFKLVTFKPELQELIFGEVSEITNFGAFMDMGIIEGMIHISQTMDDYVSFNKSNTLLGQNSKRVLKKGDLCLARVVAISFKTDQPKIGITMRQPGLGKLDWISDDKRKAKLQLEKAAKAVGGEGKAAGKKKKEE
jgi:DNA-directed RNA polymerase subunit E'